MTRSVLIIEDDPDIAEVLQFHLELARFDTRIARTGEEGLIASLDKNRRHAVILLDLLLPGMDGTEICRRLRREPATQHTPIVMVSAKTSEIDIAAALSVGADDYITKPFSVREVISRIQVLLDRVALGRAEIYDDGKLRIDFAQMLVYCHGVPAPITGLEFALLAELVRQPGRIVTEQQLIDKIWQTGHYADRRTLETNVRRLRAEIGKCGEAIETIRAVGYRFTATVAVGPDAATQVDL